MSDPSIAQQIIAGLNRLSDAQGRRVLEFVRSLGNDTPRGESGVDLIRNLPDFPAEDLEEMSRAIEEGCERVDIDGW